MHNFLYIEKLKKGAYRACRVLFLTRLLALLPRRRMHEAEQRLQQALAAQVTYQQKPEGLKEVLRAMAARPNIDSQRLRDMVYVVAATAELRA